VVDDEAVQEEARGRVERVGLRLHRLVGDRLGAADLVDAHDQRLRLRRPR